MPLALALGTNLLGQVLRLAIALLTVPVFATYFGAERFGTFYFLMALMPYFQVQALAVSRQVTAMAARGAIAAPDTVPTTPDTSGTILVGFVLSAALTLAFFLFYPLVMGEVEGARNLADEIAAARPWAAAIVLLDVVIVLQVAQMEGRRDFFASNLTRVAGQAAALYLPVSIFLYDRNFETMIAGVAVGRAAQVLLGMRWARFNIRSIAGMALPRERRADFAMLTLSSICNAISRTLDRIIIGATASAAALYYYAAPMGGTARLTMLAQATAATMAPSFAVAGQPEGRLRAMQASNAVLALIFPVCVGGIVCAPLLLTIWVDAEFAERALPFFRLGLIGTLGASLAQVPAMLVQMTGRSRWITTQQLVELPIFAGALFLASGYGLLAVAWVVALRMVLTGLIQMGIAGLPRRAWLSALGCAAFAIALVLVAPGMHALSPSASLLLAVLAAVVAAVAVHFISPDTMGYAIWHVAAWRAGSARSNEGSGHGT